VIISLSLLQNIGEGMSRVAAARLGSRDLLARRAPPQEARRRRVV
jgi:hypothetical protein